ncbi:MULTISPECIES: MFS transporter [unclassified Arthrobacter]|uniref:MFS transporter n=1 Tax=unclassified Arthrobacter TaxID=235627 RepID=UPI002101F0D3|nr:MULTISPECIES: MFS transporter [unclassified Arthrobacter]MCQ1947599.1 MFS transporter [Arthrobacter sp. zg-Y1116]MCQ1996880.1 MFS transporter [Arthrobacter sp. zg-Y1171]UWX82468.1 MFS transporter [Arthrobacter sp. zg-Y1171]
MSELPTASSPATESPSSVAQEARYPFGKREIAVGIGNFMEWFDFAIYGYFVAYISATFFPSNNETSATLAAFAVFAVGFFARPLGAAVLGPLGDRFGRRLVLMISVLVMGVCTALIGLAPGFDTIGIAAPIIVTVLRFVQGLSVGGEWTSSAMFLVESAPNSQRATRASVVSASAALAFIAGTGVALLINSVLSAEDVASWGWRIPFVISLLLGAVALYIRRNLEETLVFQQLESRRNAGEVIRAPRGAFWRGFLMAFAIAGIFGVSLYYLVTYMNNYLQQVAGMETVPALTVSIIGLVIYAALNPIAGMVSDRIGRRPMVIVPTVGFAVLGYPLFLMISTGEFWLVLIALIIWAVLQAMIAVMGVVAMVELFPASIRSTGSSLGYNVAYALLAGPGPFIATWLVSSYGPAAPSFYLIAVAVVCGAILIPLMPETRYRNLND